MKKLFFTLILLALPLQARAAQISLSPAAGNFIQGCPVTLDIMLDTEGKNTLAADAFLKYDPKRIEIIDQMEAVSGIQIKPGGVYDSSPGNVASNGSVRLTSFNRQGFFNGRGILGSIVLKAKSGADAAGIQFDFAPGRTTDSNVADADANDILSAAHGGSYTFKPGKCGGEEPPPPQQPPAEKPNLTSADVKAPPENKAPIVIHDSDAGIDPDSLNIQVNDTVYTRNGKFPFFIDGRPNNYAITIYPDPDEDIFNNAPVVIRVNGMDLNGNPIQEKIYTFKELSPLAASGGISVSSQQTLRPAAPEAVRSGLTGRWPLWLVLFCSLILNLKLWKKHKKGLRTKR